MRTLESVSSQIFDIKQCRLTGGVDHIEAAYFLSQFVGQFPMDSH